jgi:hypothetical protein
VAGVASIVNCDMAVVMGGCRCEMRGWGLCWGTGDQSGRQFCHVQRVLVAVLKQVVRPLWRLSTVLAAMTWL